MEEARAKSEARVRAAVAAYVEHLKKQAAAKEAAEAEKEAEMAAAAAAAPGQAPPKVTAFTPVKPKSKRVTIGGKSGGTVITVYQLVLAMMGGAALCMMLFLIWWQPHLILTGSASVLSLLGGFLYSYLYYTNQRVKNQMGQLVSSWRLAGAGAPLVGWLRGLSGAFGGLEHRPPWDAPAPADCSYCHMLPTPLPVPLPKSTS